MCLVNLEKLIKSESKVTQVCVISLDFENTSYKVPHKKHLKKKIGIGEREMSNNN